MRDDTVRRLTSGTAARNVIGKTDPPRGFFVLENSDGSDDAVYKGVEVK